MFFQNKVAIVTGASSGIGKALAVQLAQSKATLVLAARNQEALEATAQLCSSFTENILVVPTDVSVEASCSNLIQKTFETFGRVDILFNNAGISMWSRFDQLKSLDSLETIMQINYMGSVYCTFFALPYLKESKGQIVAISSLSGKTGVPTRSGYAASKHAMAGFFDSIRIELAEDGIGITTVYPGFVTSEIRTRAFDENGKPLGTSPVQEKKVMSAERCATLILRATEKRTRELVMTPRGKIGQLLKPFLPKLIDRIAKRAIDKGI